MEAMDGSAVVVTGEDATPGSLDGLRDALQRRGVWFPRAFVLIGVWGHSGQSLLALLPVGG
jgi:hypothetical protein